MLESTSERLGENLIGAQELGLQGIDQAVSNMFKIAVALTRLAPRMGREEEDAKIQLLHKHALDGLEMIGGEEVVDEDDDDE